MKSLDIRAEVKEETLKFASRFKNDKTWKADSISRRICKSAHRKFAIRLNKEFPSKGH